MSASTNKPKFDKSYLIEHIHQYKAQLLSANLIAIVGVATAIPIPLLMPLLVDEVLLNQPGIIVNTINYLFSKIWHSPILYILCVLLLTIFLRLITVLLYVWNTRQFTLIAKDIAHKMRERLLSHLQRTSMAEYELLGGGGVSSRFVTDINTIDLFVSESISKLVTAVFSLVGITTVLLLLNWQLALLILTLNPIVVAITMHLGKKVKQLKKRENMAFESFQQYLTETLDVIQQIRASNREKHFLGKVSQQSREIQTHSATFAWKSDAATHLSFGVFLIGFDCFRAISMVMVVFSDLSTGQMLAVFAYLWFMIGPIEQVLQIQYTWYGAKAAHSRINDLLDLKLEPAYPQELNPFVAKETVGLQLEYLHFSYQKNKPILKGISLQIKAGEKVALVGVSGSGKSTLVQVLIGLYPPDSGMVYFDQAPINQIGLGVVRENVATVLQHPAILNDSIRNNLTLGDSINDQKLWHALSIAQLDTVIQTMPKQLDTMVGRQGVKLSGGQRQRLAIARMILSEPKIIILDEATSALDNKTEAALLTALDKYLYGHTTIIVAHRLSSVRRADHIYVFENGQIIEQGVHDNLMLERGLYHKLYSSV